MQGQAIARIVREAPSLGPIPVRTALSPRPRLVPRGRAAATAAIAACLALSAALALPRDVRGAGPIPTGYQGWDISWPQCTSGGGTRTPPAGAQFAVIGISDGHPFSTDPCATAQWSWATHLAAPATVYIVPDAPHQGGAAVNQGTTGPAGTCAPPPADMACNDYNYGWNDAGFQLQSAGGLGISSQLWWLDVETKNCWDYACDGGFDTADNWRILQGYIDRLRAQGLTAGIYATEYQFGKITGGGYNPGVPIWLPDWDGNDPAGDCGLAKAFGGGQVWQVQTMPSTLSDGNRYDPDYSCPSPHGYWMDASDGGVFAFGNAGFYGSMGGTRLNKPVVGMAAPQQGGGYWLVASDGGIFAFGNAGFHGSMGNVRLNQPVVGMAATPSGNGYWMVASDGGVFALGDAGFHGSMGGTRLNQPVVGMAATPSGNGYWLVASDGGIFAFGDAGFHGSTGNIRLNKPIVGMAPTADGGGYWLVASDGGIFAFGDAPFYGAAANQRLSSPVVSMAATPDGLGYWIATAAGAVYTYGDALAYGSLAGKPLAQPIEGIAASN